MVKKKLCLLAITALLAIPTGNALAAENQQVSTNKNTGEVLGWSEHPEEKNSVSPQFTTLSTTSPVHTGSVEYKDQYTKRAVGKTKWDKYHYTRARLVNYYTGAVKTDSQRVWGSGETTAKSPYGDSGYSGRTFYGS